MNEERIKVIDERGCPICGEKHTLDDHINELEKRANLESLWVVIPWSILTTEKLTKSEKLLYGEISALQRRDGFCRASNEYLGKIIGLHPRSITRGIRKMKKLGILYIEFEDNKGKTKRRIYLNYPHITLDTSVQPPRHQCLTPTTPVSTKRIKKENRNRNNKGKKFLGKTMEDLGLRRNLTN